MIEFTENISKSFELYIYGKKFHQIGAILLDKVFKYENYFKSLIRKSEI